jgi:DNA mismatch endonuclease (patch repair protein)
LSVIQVAKNPEGFWRKKIERNREIDKNAVMALGKLGWRCGSVWECSIKGRAQLSEAAIFHRLEAWLQSPTQKIALRGRRNGVN